MIKSIKSYIKYAPKKMIAGVIMIASAIIIPTIAFAWGPSRETFTTAKPADYITFNSIVDNPAHGDERNFMQIKDADLSNSTYADSVTLTPGKKYTVFMYYHNNAASNLNLVANGSYAKAEIPAVVSKSTSNTKAVGYVGASNAKPNQVWDDITLANNTAGDIAIRMVPGSAHIYNNGKTNGASLSDSIITTGVSLGYDSLDGNIPGCNQYAGYVTFDIVADQPNFTVSKMVRLKGSSNWSETVNAKSGDTVEFQIEYKNTGTTAQNNVVIKDIMPTELTYVKGTTYLKNASNPSAKNVSDNLVSDSGINIGDYTPGSNAFIKYEATLRELDNCGSNSIVNKAEVLTSNGSKSDTASISTTKNCTTIPKNISTPSELPHTGPVDVILSSIGLGTLVASTTYYINSRRKS